MAVISLHPIFLDLVVFFVILKELGFGFLWGYRKVICESDSLEAVKLVSSHAVSSFHEHALLLAKIHYLLKRDWIVSIIHTYRETNFVADCFAKLGVGQLEECRIWSSPPAGASWRYCQML
ncbi:Ribonuclease H superfamily [Sesbania bispinosa]|nr:Ribonuclease H superfamily [Sesbania bispinosa]